jgi:diguanylate cyclase (GGDEF)-like protein
MPYSEIVESNRKGAGHRIRRSIRWRSQLTDPEHGSSPHRETNGARDRDSTDASNAADEKEANQTLADGDQTLADSDQTGSDSDQTATDVDQAAADNDQVAADHDQAASDRDFAAGGDPDVHDSSREVRQQSAHQRRHSNSKRSESALTRDAVAEARDLAAVARDEAAAMLDRELDEHDASWSANLTVGGSRTDDRAAVNRKRAAANRVSAAEARLRAAGDREDAAKDRKAAAEDRRQAQEDRDVLLRQLAASELDSLTGTRARGPGLVDLDNEIDRARRTTGLLAVAYVDVVGLKAINNSQGHSAGDALLKDAVRVIRSHLRSYDAIVRVGGDEFLCVMSGAATENARSRFDSIEAALADSGRGKIKVGIAELGPDDSAVELIDRADAGMPSSSG